MQQLEEIRQHGTVMIGISYSIRQAAQIKMVPFVCILSAAQPNPTLQGEVDSAEQLDLVARVISNGQPHRALPLTISLCIAVASKITGTLANRLLSSSSVKSPTVRLGNPSGVLEVKDRKRDV